MCGADLLRGALVYVYVYRGRRLPVPAEEEAFKRYKLMYSLHFQVDEVRRKDKGFFFVCSLKFYFYCCS